MAKIPKFSELTDVNKLKELGSSLANQAKVGEVFDKVKSSVDSLTGNKPDLSEQEQTEDPVQQQFTALSKLLNQTMATHKAQAEAINRIGKHLKQLHALIKAQQPEDNSQNTGETSADSDEHS